MGSTTFLKTIRPQCKFGASPHIHFWMATAEIVWKGKSNSEQFNKTDKLHSIMPTPVIRDGFIYGVCSYGQLRCLKLSTGERVWETMAATRATGKSGEETKPTQDDRWGNAFI